MSFALILWGRHTLYLHVNALHSSHDLDAMTESLYPLASVAAFGATPFGEAASVLLVLPWVALLRLLNFSSSGLPCKERFRRTFNLRGVFAKRK
eukprot:COSAG02_NODE_38042_length_434_cov_0.883582_1_plen_94_part_00